jgi:uncharacterized protein (UPF0333 family)
MKTQKLLIIITIAVVVIIVGGYATWALLNSNQSDDLEATPSPTATATPEPSSSPEDNVQQQVRDASMTYIKTNHPETEQLMTDLSWTGGRQETGLIGAETYVYETVHGMLGGQWWTVELTYPVVLNPVYTVAVNYTQSGVASPVNIVWQGTYQDGTITETSYSSNINSLPTQLSTQEQVRDDIMVYIEANHNETAQYMQSLNWTGGRATAEGLVGAETYVYETVHGMLGGQWWTVELAYPVVLNPVYTVSANYTQSGVLSPITIAWQGTWQNGTITETNYSFNQ